MTTVSIARPSPALAALLFVLAQAASAQPAPPAPANAEPLLVTEETATNCADLRGADVVPPVAAGGTGVAWLAVDAAANTVKWWIWFEGLTGPVTAVNLNGPAQAGATGPVTLALLASGAAGTAAPIEGEGTIPAAQIGELEAGLWYVEILTAANPAGEIRGQLTAIPTPEGIRPTDPAIANAEAAAEMMVPGACNLALDHTENPIGATPPPRGP